jgi:hypothetical protein
MGAKAQKNDGSRKKSNSGKWCKVNGVQDANERGVFLRKYCQARTKNGEKR